jgi:hypothetical protein
MLASYPVQPLAPDHALAIGATSYDGKVFYGLHADRDALPDVDVLAACIVESLDELLDASSSSRTRAPRGRVSSKRDQAVEGVIPQPARRRTSSTSRATRSALAPRKQEGTAPASSTKTVKKAARKKDT